MFQKNIMWFRVWVSKCPAGGPRPINFFAMGLFILGYFTMCVIDEEVSLGSRSSTTFTKEDDFIPWLLMCSFIFVAGISLFHRSHKEVLKNFKYFNLPKKKNKQDDIEKVVVTNKLNVDLKGFRILDINLNDSIKKLEKLGKVSEYRDGFLCYHNYGLEVSYENDTINEFIIRIIEKSSYKAYDGTFSRRQHPIAQEKLQSQQKVMKVFGEPSELVTTKIHEYLVYKKSNGQRCVFSFKDDNLIEISFSKDF